MKSVYLFRITIFILVFYCLRSSSYKDNTDYHRHSCQSTGIADRLLHFAQSKDASKYNVASLFHYINVSHIESECQSVKAPRIVIAIALLLASMQSSYVVALRNQSKTPEGHLTVLQTSEVCAAALIVYACVHTKRTCMMCTQRSSEFNCPNAQSVYILHVSYSSSAGTHPRV
jgi:hypothetical protein